MIQQIAYHESDLWKKQLQKMQEESEIAKSYPQLTELKHLLSKYATPWYIQLGQLLKRSYKRQIRTKIILISAIQTAIISVLMGSLFYQISNTQTGIRNKAGIFFFSIMIQTSAQTANISICKFISLFFSF